MTYAKIIADSTDSLGDHRLTTFEVELHRFVLAELNTHRAFSRNSASSRAIPLKKNLERANAFPAVWASEQKGMQGGDEISEYDQRHANAIWNSAAWQARHHAEELAKHGVHKSIANRLLEPFLMHRVIITSTKPGLDNFFTLRCSELAQPEIRLAADAMRDVLAESVPKLLLPGQWHTPYVTDSEDLEGHDARFVSAARCARVSYLTHEGTRDLSKDISLYTRLTTAVPPHASPLEHVARPLFNKETPIGNLEGYRQLRHEVFP